MVIARAVCLSIAFFAVASLSRAQTIDLGGYQLNPAILGLIPVFDHDLRGFIRCGDAKPANAKVDLVERPREYEDRRNASPGKWEA